MKITTSEEYGLRLALQLATSFPQAQTLGELAFREAIPQPLAAKVLAKLRRGGVVRAHRGRLGGYELAVAPTQLTLDRVLSSLGQPLFHPEFCEDHGGAKVRCVHTSDCSVRPFFFYLDRMLRDFFARTTLADLLEGEHRLAKLAQREGSLLPVWQSKAEEKIGEKA